jgi:aromatic-L-amino-acid decarboxylase
MSKYVDDFRSAAHGAVDWAADYLENTRRYPVFPRVQPGQLMDSLPPAAPQTGEPFEVIMKDFDNLIIPAVTHWNHPGFMAYFACTGSTPAIIAEMLIAALNTNGIHWVTSPALTELEQVTLGWLRKWLGLPEEFFGIIYDTASVSSLHGIAAARELADPDAREDGYKGNLTLYTSEQSHSSIEKDSIALGIGRKNVRKIPVDAEFRMRADLLEQAIERDRASGKKPFCMVATVGTTSTASIDPVPAMADLAEKYGLWLHVDAAYGGGAAVVPEFRHVFAGIERAHSVVLNAHKWMFTPMDLSVFYTRRPDILQRAFTLVPEYLQTEANSRAINLMDYAIPLGRRFRALKLWFVMRYFGREGICTLIRSQVAMAKKFASWVDADPRFKRVAPVPLSVVCFRFNGSDEQNREMLKQVNASGKVFLSHTELNGEFVIRLAIGNLGTGREDVERAWELIRNAVPE